MMKRFVAAFALGGGLLALAPAGHAQGSAPSGVWLTQDGDAQVRIDTCGDTLCGTIIWIKNPVDPETGRPLTDRRNPDPAKRSRSIVGTTIMFGMRPNGPGRWSGHFYNTRDGGTYDGNLIITGDTTVKAEGCMLICMGETWQKIENAKPAMMGKKGRKA
jgi:uncharacterized protein (DUF2147 family)